MTDMGTIEKAAARKRKWGAFQSTLLAAAAVGGVVLVGATMPNAARLLKYFPGRKSGARFNYQAKTVLGRLAKRGYIEFNEENGKRYARITEKGEQALALESERLKSAKRRRWDGRWRVVAFDIGDRRTNVRNRLRHLMSDLGFARLQNSVWIYPYDCEELIALAKADLHLGADVLYMVVEQLERDKHLRQHFNLPLD